MPPRRGPSHRVGVLPAHAGLCEDGPAVRNHTPQNPLHRRATPLHAACALLLFASACAAGANELKLAREARQRGDCAGAIPNFEKAAVANPKDPLVASALDEARTCAAALTVEEGKRAREAGDLPRALELFQKSLTYKINDDAKRLAEETRAEQSSIGKEVAKAELDLAEGHPEEGQAKAEGLIKYAPTFPGVKTIVQNAKSRIQARALVANGKAKLDAGEIESALKLFEDALRLDAGNEAAGAGRKEARRRFALGLKAQGDREVKEMHRHKALSTYDLALTYADDDAETGQKIAAAAAGLRREVQELLLRRAEAARKAKLPGAEWAWLSALGRLQIPAAERLPAPPLPDVDLAASYPVMVQATGGFADTAAVRDALVRKLREAELPLSVQLQTPVDGSPAAATPPPSGAALVVELEPAQLASRIATVETRHIDYVQSRRKDPNPSYFPAWQHVVSIEGRWVALLRERAGTNPKAKKAARAVEKALEAVHTAREEAEKERQVRIAVVEKKADAMRAEVDKLKREEDRLNAQITKEEGSKEAGHEAVVARLEEERRIIRGRLGEVRAQAAKHEDRLAVLSAPLRTDELAAAEANLQNAVTAYFAINVAAPPAVQEQERAVFDELTRARNKLASIPVTKDTEVKARHAYPVVHHERKATTTGRVRLHDTLRGATLVTATLTPSYRVEDLEITAHDEPGTPGIHIDGDPLQFPPDEELLRKLANKAASAAVDAVEPALRHHADRFLDAFAKAQSGDERIHFAVLAFRARKLLTKPAEAKVLARNVRETIGLSIDGSEDFDPAKLDALK